MEQKSMLLVNCLVMALALMVADKSITEAQETPSCAMKLTSCLPYLNATQPPANCCTPLKEAVQNELPCLCNLYNTPGLLSSVGLNITSANDLSHRCGINSTISDCKNALAPHPSKPDTPTPPGSPVGDKGDSSRVANNGVVAFVLLFLASAMLY